MERLDASTVNRRMARCSSIAKSVGMKPGHQIMGENKDENKNKTSKCQKGRTFGGNLEAQ